MPIRYGGYEESELLHYMTMPTLVSETLISMLSAPRVNQMAKCSLKSLKELLVLFRGSKLSRIMYPLRSRR